MKEGETMGIIAFEGASAVYNYGIQTKTERTSCPLGL